MAVTYEVETWQDIVDLATQSQADAFTDDVTIKLTSDIDCNSEIPEGVESTLNFKTRKSAVVTITIDGYYEVNGEAKSHVIKNLRTHVITPVYIFRATNASTVSAAGIALMLRNIDFANLILDKEIIYTTGSSQLVGIYNCRFVGKRSCNLFAGYYNRAHSLTRCYFNVKYSEVSPTLAKLLIFRSATSSSITDLSMNFCRVVESYNGWQPDDTKSCTSFGNAKLNGCYISGEIVGGSVLTLTSMYAQDSSIQNVIDADLKTTAQQGTTITVNAPEGVWRNDIHSTDSSITGTYSYTNTNQYALPETPSDMVDTTELYNDGFDVVH